MNSTTSTPQPPQFVSSTLLLGTFNIFSLVLGLAGTAIITRHFPIEIFGTYSLILVLVSFLSQVSTLGLDLSVSKFISGAKDESSKERFLATAVMVRICAILMASALAWYGSPLLQMLFGKSLLPRFLVFVPLLFAMESLRTLLKSILQGCLLFPRMGISDLIAGLMNFGVVVFLVYVFNSDITWLILARFFSSFLASVFAFISIPIRKRIYFDIPTFNELMKFGLPLQLNGILNFIYSRIDTIVIAAFLGPADIALYEVARKIPDYLRSLYDPFISVYYPLIGKRYALEGQQQASRLFNNAIRFVTFITITGAVIATLFGKEIIKLLFSDKYLASAPIFALLMLNQSIVLSSSTMGYTLVAVGDSDKPVIINTFNAIASWLGCVLLVPVYALFGAAVGNTIGTVIAYPLNRYFLRKRLALLDMAYLKPLVLFCVLGMLVIFIRPASLFVRVGFFVVFILAGVLLSIITKDDFILLVKGSGVSSLLPLRKLAMWVSKL